MKQQEHQVARLYWERIPWDWWIWDLQWQRERISTWPWVQEDTCTSTLSNMTVATRHVSWQEDISLKHHRFCVLIGISQRHPYCYLSELNGCETWSRRIMCVLGKLHTGESVHRCWPRVRTTREARTDNLQGSLRTEIIRTQMVATICRRTTTDGILPPKRRKTSGWETKVITTNTWSTSTIYL
jgi:hypothetical protein